MSTAEDTLEEELRQTKYPKFRVLTGGGMPPEGPRKPTDEFNWLAAQEVGTHFWTRHRASKEVDYNEYFIRFMNLPWAVLLEWRLPDGKILNYPVDPQRFSNMFEPPVVLGVEKQESL